MSIADETSAYKRCWRYYMHYFDILVYDLTLQLVSCLTTLQQKGKTLKLNFNLLTAITWRTAFCLAGDILWQPSETFSQKNLNLGKC